MVYRAQVFVGLVLEGFVFMRSLDNHQHVCPILSPSFTICLCYTFCFNMLLNTCYGYDAH